MLKELIDNFYLEQQKNGEQAHFYVTDAGKCARAIFFKFKNLPREKIEPRVLRIFEHGEFLHRNIFNILYRLKIGVTTEVPIPPQAIISGRADAILCIGGENYVLDIKSINSMQFRKLDAPKPDNINQLQLYMHYFEITKGLLLYIDKDQQEIKEFVVNYDQVLAKGLLDELHILRDKIEQNMVPAALTDYPKNWQCSWCQFRDICKTAGKDELAWETLKTQLSDKCLEDGALNIDKI